MPVKEANELKALETQIKREQEKLDELFSKQEAQNKEVKDQIEVVKELRSKYRTLTTNIIVSEHAILRYLERIEGINLADIREKILTPKVKEMAKQLGNAEYPQGSFKVVIKNNVVVTVHEGGK